MKISNVKIAEMVNKNLEEKNIFMNWADLLVIVDDSIFYDETLDKDEWGDINNISECSLLDLIQNLTNGIINDFEYQEFIIF